jgi:hypothetical protein
MQKHELYSHVFSRVITPERTIQGTCFRSDERMEHYLVSNSRGSFITDDLEDNKEDSNRQSVAEGDTAQSEPQVRPAATRHASSKMN